MHKSENLLRFFPVNFVSCLKLETAVQIIKRLYHTEQVVYKKQNNNNNNKRKNNKNKKI